MTGGLDLGRLYGERVAQPAELAAQVINLVEQAEDERQRIVLDGELLANFEDQLDPGDIDVMEDPGLVTPLRQHPAIFDPRDELAPIERGVATQQIFE
mgnify:CR=1 FL=1